MVNTRNSGRNNLGPYNTLDDGQSTNPIVTIANLNERLAEAQKNMEDLSAHNALLQAARTPPPSHELTGREENSQTGGRQSDGGDPSTHQEGSGEKIELGRLIPRILHLPKPKHRGVISYPRQSSETRRERLP
jgi:hypothetical protein